MTFRATRKLMLSTSFAALAMAGTAEAQVTPTASSVAVAAPAPTESAKTDQSPEIIVTGVAKGRNRLDASVSTSSISADQIAASAPRSAAELLRSIPGIRAESSGGEGNANINVRGLPVSTGGAKFLQLQEDGLPILEFGDIIFGNADIFTRIDTSIARVESIRGGSASTFTSNSPGGIVNFITKDGSTRGGSVVATLGLDYGEHRLDAEYGGRLGPSTKFHVGGFYRIGEGARDAGYNGNKGGQIRANVTQQLGGRGYVRLNLKYLNDRSIGYLPSPVRVGGSNSNPDYQAIPGLDPNNETLHSKFFRKVLTLDGNNRPITDDIADGMHPKVFSVGTEVNYDIADKINFTDRFRYSDISGGFISPFPAGVDTAQNVANSIGGPGSTLYYASGPNKGQQITNPAGLNGNGLIVPIVLFNTHLNNLNNITNDARLSTTLAAGGGELSLTGGLYYSHQNIDTTWLWTSHLLAADGTNAALIDVRNALGVPQTYNGTVGYGASFFGNCCRRAYDLKYTTTAPFFSVGFESGPFNIDASMRFDHGRVRGTATSDGPVVTVDVNGDGIIQVPETKTTVINPANRRRVAYSYNYTSYSVGATYRVQRNLALFARYSRGARANADRLIFGPAISPTGGLLDKSAVIDFVKQAEAGVKYRGGPLELYLTAFHSDTEETNFDFGLGFFSNKYRANGLEAEGALHFGNFLVDATGTITDAKITAASASPTLVGNRPRRQAKFVYSVAPQYRTKLFTVGASAVGTSSSYTQDSNQLKLPGFTTVNAFASVRPIDRVELMVNANNLFNVAGYTEAEEGSIPANGYVRARSINGRTISASVRLNF